MKLYSLFLLILLAGCDSQETINTKNQKTFASGGEVVGSLPDGRVITRYQIYNNLQASHWVYTVGNDVTVCHQSGKVQNVEVLIDGVTYVPKVEK